jgi:hypothetical protein
MGDVVGPAEITLRRHRQCNEQDEDQSEENQVKFMPEEICHAGFVAEWPQR